MKDVILDSKKKSEADNLSQYITNLGVQVMNVSLPTGAVGREATGNDVIYTVVTGETALFVIVDIKTKTVLKQFRLPGVTGTWTVLSTRNGIVYIGGYNKAYLYKYDDSNNLLENLGIPIPGTSVLYQMSEGKDGKIYGGAYPSGSLWEYDPVQNRITDMGQTVPGCDYTRSTAYDSENCKLYAGTGTRPGVVEIDLNKPDYLTDKVRRKDILPQVYKHEEKKNIVFAYDLNYVHGKVFVKKSDTVHEMIVLEAATGKLIDVIDKETGKQIHDIPMSSRGVSPKNPNENKVYYTHEGYLYSYDLVENCIERVKKKANPNEYMRVKFEAITYGYVQLNEEGWPGYTLVMLVGNGGHLCKYNLETDRVVVELIDLPKQPVLINDISKGPDGKIYAGGYLSGNVGVYNPTAGETEIFYGISQSEGMTNLGIKMYFGVYPKARILEYDLSKPWKREGNRDICQEANPLEILCLAEECFGKQDRPFAMLGVEEENKVFIGTAPYYGKVGGALAVYDASVRKAEVYSGDTSIAPDQSIMTLAYQRGMLYIGTSVAGGINSVPTTSEGKLIIWDGAKKEKVFETIPVEGKISINGLIIGPDKNIWGLANGTLFIFDTKCRKVIYRKDITPDYIRNWRDGFLSLGADGNVYGTSGGKLYKIDSNTKDVTMIIDDEVFGLAQDDIGNLYMKKGNQMLRYTIPGLKLK